MLFSNALIGLREGLEAALVISILVAFLVRTERRSALPLVWAGVGGVAVAASVAAGALLTFTTASLSFEQQEAFGGFASIVAIALVTGMIFWMRRTARFLAGHLREKLDQALEIGPIAVVAVAVALAWLLYLGAAKVNLAKFFTVTGVLLVFVAAWVLAYGVHDLQEAAILPGLNTLAFDVSDYVPADSWYGTLLKGIFNFSPQTTVLEAVVWGGYVATVLTLFLAPQRNTTQDTAQ